MHLLVVLVGDGIVARARFQINAILNSHLCRLELPMTANVNQMIFALAWKAIALVWSHGQGTASHHAVELCTRDKYRGCVYET